jgi:hypothetical protein
MKRNLILLNVLLVGLIVAAGWKVQGEWAAQKEHEDQIRKAKVTPPPVPAVSIPAAPPPVVAASYSDIANKMLFSKERNPNIVVVVVEKPKPPMPPLPILHGVMGLPSGMLALMSADAKSPSKGVKVGDTVGAFELADLTRDEISLKWEDKTVTKSVSEMIYHGLEVAEKAPPASAPPSASSGSSIVSAPAAQGPGKPGVQSVGEQDVKTCTPGDNSPNGTVADGYRKVLIPNPFGSSCHWELVK